MYGEQYPRRLTKSFILALILLVLVWGSVGFLWWQRQAVYDWWRLRGYEAPAEIIELADNTSMNDDARRLFYVYHPRIEDADQFNNHCRKENEFTIVLGCYVSNDGIYLFRVDDERLDGIVEVTAAHELLHAAYDRLSDDERAAVDKLTADTAKNLKNERLKSTIAEYQANDPSSVPNELHSILGSEVRDLPAGLEKHYKQYFTDRSKIVAYAEDYERAFAARKQQIESLAADLERRRAEIERRNAALTRESAALQTEFQRLNQERNSLSAQEFQSQANAYNADVQTYNSEVAAVSGLIDTYNDLLENYEALVVERQGLFEAIDSRPQAIQES